MQPAATPSPTEERLLVEALRNGDEAAFSSLVERYSPSMLRVALLYVPSRAVAEEVVQDAWLGVLRGLDRFEGRSSLKTWIFHILANNAKTRGKRERRTIPFSWLLRGREADEPAVDPDRFVETAEAGAGHWATPPRRFEELPEERLLSRETRAFIDEAIAALPPKQREVITLRDVEGWSSEEVCNVLDISETNQRVLLHRARSRVRQALETHLGLEPR